MFIGHFGVGLVAKPAARRTSLGTPFLAVLHAGNLLGPPPPSVAALAWGYWIDRHRQARPGAGSA